MRAAEDDGVYLRIGHEQLVDAFFYEVVGARGVHFIVFHQGNPEGASHTGDLYIGREFLYFERVALALDGAFCGQDAYVACLCELPNDLCRWTDDAEDSFLGYMVSGER